jgi:DNA invertase Pin-like site-specific DNA recombinase
VSTVRLAIYLRVSTDQQAGAGYGLEIQREECTAWLRAHRHRSAGLFVDEGRSGASDVGDRPGLAGALALIGGDRADGLLVYRLDRLARDVILQEQLLAELHRRGKVLHSCFAAEDDNLEHTPDDPTRAMVRRILGCVAEYEREMIRLRLKAGRLRKALGGGYVGGGPPYGYAAVSRELEPVPAEQDAVKLMRRLRGQGLSYRQIVAELERRGIAPRTAAGNWQPNTIRAILMREEARRPGRSSKALPSPDLAEVTA